jgi:hypothetical protein
MYRTQLNGYKIHSKRIQIVSILMILKTNNTQSNIDIKIVAFDVIIKIYFDDLLITILLIQKINNPNMIQDKK